MSTQNENRDLASRGSHEHRSDAEATMVALSKAVGTIAMVFAFTIQDPGLRLWVMSAAGLMIGGSR